MFITSNPVALPAVCMFCPGSVRREFVDTTLQIEFHGAVIICRECVEDMGHMFGMATENDLTHLMETNKALHDTVFSLQTQLAGMENIRRGLAAAGFVVPDSSRELAVSLPDDKGVEPEPLEQGGDVGSGERTAPEPLHDEGMDELRSAAKRHAGVLKL